MKPEEKRTDVKVKPTVLLQYKQIFFQQKLTQNFVCKVFLAETEEQNLHTKTACSTQKLL